MTLMTPKEEEKQRGKMEHIKLEVSIHGAKLQVHENMESWGLKRQKLHHSTKWQNDSSLRRKKNRP